MDRLGPKARGALPRSSGDGADRTNAADRPTRARAALLQRICPATDARGYGDPQGPAFSSIKRRQRRPACNACGTGRTRRTDLPASFSECDGYDRNRLCSTPPSRQGARAPTIWTPSYRSRRMGGRLLRLRFVSEDILSDCRSDAWRIPPAVPSLAATLEGGAVNWSLSATAGCRPMGRKPSIHIILCRRAQPATRSLYRSAPCSGCPRS